MARTRVSKAAPAPGKSRATRRKRSNVPSSEASVPNPSGEGRLDHRDSNGRREIIVRMYRQGLGDCFLMALPTESAESPKYLLIDCGVHARETDGTKRLEHVLGNIVTATGGHLDVVAATHEHADHLSGFVQKGSPFLTNSLTLSELWLAWTERRGDAKADKLRKQRGTATEVIKKAVEQARNRAGLAGGKLARELENIADFEESDTAAIDVDVVTSLIQEQLADKPAASVFVEPSEMGRPPGPGVDNSKGKRESKAKPSSNELALGLLSAKAEKGRTRFFVPGQVATLEDVKDLRAYVFGPPRDNEMLGRSDPSKIRGRSERHRDGIYKEVYLSGGDSTRPLTLSPVLGVESETQTGPISDDFLYPFPRQFRRKYQSMSASGQRPRIVWETSNDQDNSATSGFLHTTYLDPAQDWRRIDGDWLQSAGQLALNLVGDTNNTSLVLAFEWGPPGKGKVLLFPGDAQVGNWLSWREQKYEAEGVTMTADDLLRRTILYKVGHHGSHNATARRDSDETTEEHPLGVPFGLELMNDIVAMIPVDWQAVKKNMPDPWEMPYNKLYRRLREKSRLRVLRADESITPLRSPEEPDIVPTSEHWQPVPGLKHARWRRSAEKFQFGDNKGPLYYDVAFELEE
jgi:beta-lactamase superfamily II metal-dependent hydrolase